MKAAPADQLRLLDLQAIDTTLDQLAHRRRTLPEDAEADRLAAKCREVEAEVVRIDTEGSDLDSAQRKLEDQVDQVRARADRDRARLRTSTAPREAESLQHEVDSLGRRQSDLEDQLLELMEQREEVEQRLTGGRARLADAAQRLADAEARRDAALAEITEAERARRAERTTVAAGLPGDLLTLYERIRASSAGTGAARLWRRRCEGCHLELSGTDLAAVRGAPEDEVLRCEECRRILVRTAESGL